ncbi:hypothetical protein ENSA5_06670 [Enhygromyxa salina]|uniref:Uncharacterized protein n=1 Tax=Enhygromyxa salina TaxID=215803 RepID=A0A2S9YHF0_9BACT|nr:hypothetical protein ENSA5_06670 [Enhygromyxa salina]
MPRAASLGLFAEGCLYRLQDSGLRPDNLAALGPQVLGDCLYRLQDSGLRPDNLAALGPQVLGDCLYQGGLSTCSRATQPVLPSKQTSKLLAASSRSSSSDRRAAP